MMFASAIFMTSAVVSQSQAPTVDFLQMLGMEYHCESGLFDLGEVVVAFPNPSVSEYKFVVKKDGQEVKSVAASKSPFISYGNFICLSSEGDSIYTANSSGSYEINVMADAEVLRSLKFEVKEESGGDAYSPTKNYHLVGPWSQYMVLRSRPDKPDEAMEGVFWSYPGETQSGATCPITVTILKGGTPVAQTRPYTLSGASWKQQTVPFWKPDNRFFFTAKDLLALNSDFEVVIKHGEKRARSFKGHASPQGFQHLPVAMTSYRPAADILLPKTMVFTDPASPRSSLQDAFWLKAN